MFNVSFFLHRLESVTSNLRNSETVAHYLKILRFIWYIQRYHSILWFRWSLVPKFFAGLFLNGSIIVSQPSKCLKFMTFREGCFAIHVEYKYLKCIWNEILTLSFFLNLNNFMVYKEFTTFPRKFDHGKVFFSLPEVGKYAPRDTNCHWTVWRHRYEWEFKNMSFTMASDEKERPSLVSSYWRWEVLCSMQPW